MTQYLDKIASLTPHAKRVICDKGTEAPFSSPLNQLNTSGTYLCRRCGWALFRGDSQFTAGCGWPSFDAEIKTRVKKIADRDGVRTEILCGRCEAHLGHLFKGEYLTAKNQRYSVNGLALDFVENQTVEDTEEAIVAGGCFWGVEYFLNKLSGVVWTEVGYTGGTLPNPSYEAVCSGQSGHKEAVRVLFDKEKTNYQTILSHFFEIHDPTQSNGQGPDIGTQYQSAIFYYDARQQETAAALIAILKNKQVAVVTQLLPAQPFWCAEAYHQRYYTKNKGIPYCHHRVSRLGAV